MHIIFDCDGTLISSHEAVLSCLKYIIDSYHHKEHNLDDIRRSYGTRLGDFFSVFEMDITEPDIKSFVDSKWNEYLEKSKFDYALFPGIQEVIKHLFELNFTLHVWTLRDKKSTLEILKGLDLAKYFNGIVCGDDRFPKPRPSGMLQHVSGVDPKKIFMIGDTETDIIAGRSLNCMTMAAAWGDSVHPSLKAARPDFWAESPLEAFGYIKSYFKVKE